MIAKLVRFARRFAVMLGGEVLQSAFGFALNITLARTLPAASYGMFAIVVLIGGFGILYMRALIGVPACTYIPQSRRDAVARAYAVSFGSGALVVSILGAVVVAAALSLWQPLVAITGGAFVGAWSLRSYVRMALFAQNRAVLATLSDFAYTIVAASLCVLLMLRDDPDGLSQNVFLVLTIAHIVGVGVGLLMLRQPVRISLRRSVRRRFQTLLPSMTWSIVSVTVANIQGQGAVLLLAVIAGPAAYAPIAATMAFFSPLRLAAAALANMTQPDLAAKLARPGERGVLDVLLLSTGLILGVCALYGVAMALTFPSLSQHAFADRFGDAPLNLIALEIWAIATVAVLYSVPRTLLEALQKFQLITWLATVGAFVGMPILALLIVVSSPAWSLLGLLASEIVVLIGCWIAAFKVIRGRSETVASEAARPAWLYRFKASRDMRSLDINAIRKTGADV